MHITQLCGSVIYSKWLHVNKCIQLLFLCFLARIYEDPARGGGGGGGFGLTDTGGTPMDMPLVAIIYMLIVQSPDDAEKDTARKQRKAPSCHESPAMKV